MAFDVRSYMRKYGKLTTKVVGLDGTKVTLPGAAEAYTVEALKALAKTTNEDTPTKVSLPGTMVNGRDVKENGRIYAEHAAVLVGGILGEDVPDEAAVPVNRIANVQPAVANGKK